MDRQLILSIFPGIDLLGRAFEAAGFCVVRGPDLIWGGRVEEFHPLLRAFDGIIGGSPCQDFSRARRTASTGHGVRMLKEFARVVTECRPAWWLLENVPGVPDVNIEGYLVQRLNLAAEDFGLAQRRLRRFQFGYRDRAGLVVPRGGTRKISGRTCCMATEGNRKQRRSWGDFCELIGLPRDFDVPHVSLGGKYRLVGNGVPLPMGRALAIAIKSRHDTIDVKACVCQCGRPVAGRQLHATAACRKRMERSRRDSAGVTGAGPVTAGCAQ